MADEIVKPQVKVVVKSEDENLPEFKIEAAKEDFSKNYAKLDESQDLAIKENKHLDEYPASKDIRYWLK